MTLLETLQHDMTSSMKQGDATRTGTIRLLRSAMQNEAIKVGHALDDGEAMKVLQREAKQRRDSITQYAAAGRDDLVAVEEGELKLIDGYLPQPLDEAELSSIVDSVITELGATDASKLGAVIGAVLAQVGATADGGTVSKLVRSRLVP